ncbi:hypothetical protein WJX72_001910 [[Myrmecia] bisecta]|uniref:K Homology domain-containing protein n=1 Tax=[Myrmecia] bisecta TaxID=41462 RepID=A0AAW1R548_9CHLO
MEDAQEAPYANSPHRSDATMDSCGQKRAAPDGDDLRSQHGDSKRLAATPPVTYRLLCPSARTGSVIGKKGDVIQQLRRETGSKIKIEEAVPNCDERVILIMAPDCPGADWSPAQEALFRVHSRMVEGDSDNTDLQGLNITVRLLVDGSQIGCVLGKGGTIISDLRVETGANIRILGKKERPLCALETDELVQLNGDPSKVREALTRISAQLRANPAKHKPNNARKIALSATATAFNNATGSLAGGGPVINLVADSTMLGMLPTAQMAPRAMLQAGGSRETSYRLLCPQANTGSIIGRKGDVVRQIREQTGAQVKVHAGSVGCEERIVQMSSLEDPVSQFCNAQEGLLRCCECILKDQREAAHQAIRLLVPSPQGSLLMSNAHAQILADLRIVCNVQVRVLPLTPPLPKGAEEGDQVVHLEGPLVSCLTAVQRIAQVLRAMQMPMDGGAGLSMPPGSAAGPFPGGMSMGHPAHAMPQGMMILPMAPGYPGSISPMLNAPMDVSGPYMPMHPGGSLDDGLPHGPRPSQPPAPPQRHPLCATGHGGHAGGGPSGHSVHLVLLPMQVGCILGKGGANIAQIRQISGARVKVHPATAHSGERDMEMSGSLEQCQAAQNLVQAFLLAGGAPPLANLQGQPYYH